LGRFSEPLIRNALASAQRFDSQLALNRVDLLKKTSERAIFNELLLRRRALHFKTSVIQVQVMRQAYPGAVYHYQTQPFRVYRVNSFKADLAGGSELGIADRVGRMQRCA
jgi:hypothetical protein